MSVFLRGLQLRLRALLRRAAVEQDLDEEIRQHLELEAQKYSDEGFEPEEARRRAALNFGSVDAAKEAHRDHRGTRLVEDAIADARFAMRTLARNPLLSAAAILTLALGIGANTAIFSVVNAVLLRLLPYPHADQLVMLSEDNPERGWVHADVAPANYLDWKERVRSFADVAAFESGGGATLGGAGEPQRIS